MQFKRDAVLPGFPLRVVQRHRLGRLDCSARWIQRLLLSRIVSLVFGSHQQCISAHGRLTGNINFNGNSIKVPQVLPVGLLH